MAKNSHSQKAQTATNSADGPLQSFQKKLHRETLNSAG